MLQLPCPTNSSFYSEVQMIDFCLCSFYGGYVTVLKMNMCGWCAGGWSGGRYDWLLLTWFNPAVSVQCLILCANLPPCLFSPASPLLGHTSSSVLWIVLATPFPKLGWKPGATDCWAQFLYGPPSTPQAGAYPGFFPLLGHGESCWGSRGKSCIDTYLS